MTINLTKYNALIHRAITKIAPPNSYSRFITSLLALSLAVVALFATSALSSCSKDIIDAPVEDMEYFYYESCGLTKVAGDSIQRFATKVDTYVTRYPETKTNPHFPDIVDNIKEAAKNCGLVITLNFDPEWDGEIEYHF